MVRTLKITDFIETKKQNENKRQSVVTKSQQNCCDELLKYAERCNAKEVIAYLLRYPSVGAIRIKQDLSWLKTKGIKLHEVLECLNRTVIRMNEYVVNLEQKYWNCDCAILTNVTKKP